ncbi:MAG: hypothetical protein A3J46_04000 [Candidatus Yanofskybacteria bacterium RIFCSPHIGHO2_02_FULL_41_11]|uniref:Homing endonuclease LAGLIDADG domain-containing protein n=1 Tax=Candidatus Yanofskybacteria bacterium RIFCSPHIGHO2_02_FULL_41_11 TaxID=1802675 RepID=A0A1F8F4C1_9BACT|nr:MAG: hypothetical protein A3J46_04000 [Candidatus Yanofskybacteria bacterium RIFCSPHIGHO2_02_FULL_41_11]
MRSRIQQSYLAGFLDADGSIYVQAKPNRTYRYGFQIAPYIVLFQSAKDRTNFENVCALIGTGYLRKRKDGILEYIIGRSFAIKEFIKDVYPFLILKKRQAELLLRIFKEKERVKSKQDFEKLLILVDRFRELNYSKKRKHR